MKESAKNYQYCFESYGVRIAVGAQSESVARAVERRIGEILPNGVEKIPPPEAEHFFDVQMKGNGAFEIYKDGERVAGNGAAAGGGIFFDCINSLIRLCVAEYAVGRVFLHAGAVAWKGRALVIPASSFSGKSALVAALVKQGAEYYSDEYAVLDENGLVSSFPKTLSLRGIKNDYEQVERTVESLGGSAGVRAVPIGLVLICRYDRRAEEISELTPEILNAGQGTLEILAHAIPVRRNPSFVLDVLYKVSSRAIIAKCKRGEADGFAELLLKYLDAVF